MAFEFDDPFPPPAERAFADFPPSLARLQEVYAGFVPSFEMRRESLSEYVRNKLSEISPTSNADAIRAPTGHSLSCDVDLLQRHFAWSATCFVRAYSLLLTYVIISRRGLSSWATVTGYYSRFYSAKALANLCLASWVDVDLRASNGGPSHGKNWKFLVYTGAEHTRLIEGSRLPTSMVPNASHERWWRLLDQLRHIPDLAETDPMTTALQPWPFTSERRNEVNYSDVWMEGFPELEWFDTSVEQMLAHMSFASARQDDDFTDIDRYFVGMDPESADVADYYTDPAVALWQTVIAYLDLVGILVPAQNVVTTDKLIALAERTLGSDSPRTLEGLRLALRERDSAT